MSRLRFLLSSLLLLGFWSASPASLAAQAPVKVDVSGRWIFNVTTDAGVGSPTVTFRQQGDSLTGTYTSQTFGTESLKGRVKDRTVTFSIEVEMQGTTLQVVFSGELQDPKNENMKGTVDFSAQARGTFTAIRQTTGGVSK
jgi:hypothetical protein